MQALSVASRTCVRSADPGSASSPRILSTAHHYASVDNKRETKRKKKKREKELKKKRIKQRNNEFSFTPIYPYRGPIRTRNEKLIICKHVEETFEEKISKTDDALPPLDGWPRRIEDEN